MSEKETWYTIETSRADEGDWNAYTNTTYDSAGFAWREVRKLQKYLALDPQRWDVRVVRNDLTTTVEDNPIGVCAKCRADIASMRGVVTADDGALFHGRCWGK